MNNGLHPHFGSKKKRYVCDNHIGGYNGCTNKAEISDLFTHLTICKSCWDAWKYNQYLQGLKVLGMMREIETLYKRELNKEGEGYTLENA